MLDSDHTTENSQGKEDLIEGNVSCDLEWVSNTGLHDT